MMKCGKTEGALTALHNAVFYSASSEDDVLPSDAEFGFQNKFVSLGN